MKKKVVVIGGGIAGLSAGIYAQRCGFDVTVLESHSIAGGNCTSWRRGDYLFEGGMHWLTGSDAKQPINKMWRYVGALNDDVTIHCPEPFIEYLHKGTSIRFYRDVDKTEEHLIALSPADEKEIKRLCNNIRKVQKLGMPITDIRGVKVTKKQRPSLSLLFTALSAYRIIRSFSKISRTEYASRFSHEGIRKLILSSSSDNTGIFPIFFTLGVLSSGDGGFPEGGSLPFVQRIVKRFKSLGGTLLLNTRAERVVVEEGRARGVVVAGELMPADAVIVTSDTMNAEKLFDIPLESDWLSTMRATAEPTMATLISLGIDADLSAYNKGLVLGLEAPIRLGSQSYDFVSINNYAEDGNYQPKGKSAITIILDGDTYDHWEQAKAEGWYKDEKQRIADAVIAAIATQIPEIGGKVEVIDVATPLTYERYCDNWRGSWMTEMTSGISMNGYPAVIPGLSRVYFAGQRMMPPGGLPVALDTGRAAVQYLCRDTDTLFISEE